MTPAARAASRRICNAATPGSWEHGGSSTEPNTEWVWEGTHHAAGDPEAPDNLICLARSADAAFIAHARTALPEALSALDAADARVAELERLGDAMADVLDDSSDAEQAWRAARKR